MYEVSVRGVTSTPTRPSPALMVGGFDVGSKVASVCG